MSDIAAEEANGKVNQLQLVFSKAMDVTFESLGPNDITSCFGELRNELGNSLDGKLVQQLALSKNRLQVSLDYDFFSFSCLLNYCRASSRHCATGTILLENF